MIPGPANPHNPGSIFADGLRVSEQLLCYEHPLNERMRAALRFEFLFKEWAQLAEHATLRRPLIAVICDLLSLLSRPDTWSDMAKDLQHELDHLVSLRERPGVDTGRLQDTLEDMQQAHLNLSRIDATRIRIPKLLLAVMQRASVPGGLAPADIPPYTYWLNQPPERQLRDIQEWTQGFETFSTALSLYLHVLRSKAHWDMTPLDQGQCTLQAHPKAQLLRVAMPPDAPWYPEISGGRQRMTIRLRGLDTADNERALRQSSLQIALC